MGSVWRATHEQLGTQVAVKFIGQALLGDAESYARFRSEAQVTASLQSAFIARTQDYDVCEGVPFLVMDLLRGESLKHRLARVRRLSPQETALLVFQVARGLTVRSRRKLGGVDCPTPVRQSQSPL
jgi:serine/threonine-protein kinase